MSEQPRVLQLADELETWRGYVSTQAAAELRHLHALCEEMGKALIGLEREFRRVFPIYYYSEPWAHETNIPLKVAQISIAKWKESK